MPTISFDTIERSEVTGLEMTHHEYVIDYHDESNIIILHYVDGVWMDTHDGKYATELLDSLIHEKTTTKKATTKTADTAKHEDVSSDRRRKHLVRGSNVGKEADERKIPVQADLFNEQL